MFQDFSARALAPDHPQSAATMRREEAGDLIRRYPNLGEIELARLINLYREFSALDMALTMSDEELAPRLDRFSADHRSKMQDSVPPICGADPLSGADDHRPCVGRFGRFLNEENQAVSFSAAIAAMIARMSSTRTMLAGS